MGGVYRWRPRTSAAGGQLRLDTTDNRIRPNYTPVIAGADPDTLEGAGEQIGGVLGLFIWTVLFAIFAAIIGVIGRSIKKRAHEID